MKVSILTWKRKNAEPSYFAGKKYQPVYAAFVDIKGVQGVVAAVDKTHVTVMVPGTPVPTPKKFTHAEFEQHAIDLKKDGLYYSYHRNER